MRLLGLALFTLLVMGLIQFALWTDRDTSVRLVGSLDSSERIVHDLVSDARASVPARLGGVTHTFVVRERDTWNALAGSPGYHKARFNLPRDARAESGTLFLDLSAQLQDEGIARMRININGERRGEVVLPEGQTEHRIEMNLLPSDLTSSVLEVSLAATGRFPQLTCSAHWSGGMVVRVEPTSRVELKTAAPLATLEDRLRATGDPVRMVWAEDVGPVDMARVLRFAVDQNARGRGPMFALDKANAVVLSAADLDQADAIVETALPMPAPTWPLDVTQIGNLGAAKFFEFSTSWRIPYDLRATPDAELPTHLDLDFSLLGLQETEKWMLSVVLNDKAIHTERLIDAPERMTRTVPLPVDEQGFSNVIEVKLINAEPRSGLECLSGVPVMAQLENGTRLRGGVAPADPLVSDFITALPATLELEVASPLNAAEATTAMAFLSDTFGGSKSWQPVHRMSPDTAGGVQVVWRNHVPDLATKLMAAPDRDIWLVWPTLAGDLGTPYGLKRLATAHDIAVYMAQDGARIAALVSLPKAQAETPSESVATARPPEADTTAPRFAQAAPSTLDIAFHQFDRPKNQTAPMGLFRPLTLDVPPQIAPQAVPRTFVGRVFRSSRPVPRPTRLIADLVVPTLATNGIVTLSTQRDTNP